MDNIGEVGKLEMGITNYEFQSCRFIFTAAGIRLWTSLRDRTGLEDLLGLNC